MSSAAGRTDTTRSSASSAGSASTTSSGSAPSRPACGSPAPTRGCRPTAAISSPLQRSAFSRPPAARPASRSGWKNGSRWRPVWGGGSSNAAGVLEGLNRLYGNPLAPGRLREIGRSLGADVPFFLFGPPALASGIGDELEPYPGPAAFTALVVTPPYGVSTRMVYQKLNLELTKAEKRPTRAHFENTVFSPARHLWNDLETVTLDRHPELRRLKGLLLDLGAEGALMSGSGPSVFGLFARREAAASAARALPRHPGWRFFCVDLLPSAAAVIEEK
ncbi:MAG: hypothetical protein WHT06_16370 [Desulfobacterales bacterium]